MSDAPPVRSSWTLPPIPAVLLAVVSVQGGAAFAKELFPRLGQAGTAGMRIGLSALLLFAVFRPPLARFTRVQWRAVIPYGVVLGAMNLSFYLALGRIPLGLAVTLEFVGPLALAVSGSRRASDFLWVVLAAAGIVLITPWRGGVGAIDPLGVLMALFAGACWAAYIVLGGRVSKVLPGGQSVATGMLFASLAVLPFSFAEGLAERLTPSLLAAALAVALLSGAVPFTLEMMALRVLSSRTFGILMSLEPAVAALSGLVFLHEQLTGMQWLALGFVSAASAGAALTARRVPPLVEA
ncbi:DMT family transporter [Stigmatella sp. ncwal1]|uniref:DMT family transporter n=1 Tax=Stigmatella ashevillensis TaxID=2995309 RepID=A0ABT5DNN3_9BACT|nr:DMT family transporter [Stigmatella ashevillena]MDC0713986.1 DMT family transporter [Stigmatella ashevillena]